MDMPQTTTVSWLLANARTLPRWAIVCLPPLSPLAGEDACIVVDSRELGDDEDIPADARTQGFSRTLSARAVAAVLDNLDQQIDVPTQADQIDALNYFVAADAFISLTKGKQ